MRTTPVRRPGAPFNLHQRLQLYSRYTSLVAAQEQALDQGDMEEFETLTDSREELQEDLEEAGGPLHESLQARLDEASEALVGKAMRDLRTALEADRRIRQKLEAIRDETLDEFRRIETIGPGAQRYLEGAEKPEERPPARVDVKL